MESISKILTPARKGVRLTAAALLLIVAAPAVKAQEWYIPRYIIGDVGGGLQTIQFNPHDGKHNVGAGFRLNGSAVFMIDSHWGVNAGIGVARYASKAKYNDMRETSVAYDSNINAKLLDTTMMVNPTYTFCTEFKDFTEKQNLLQIEIPVTAYFQYPFNSKFDVIGRAGFKFGIPVVSRYKLMSGTYETSAEFADMNGKGLNVEIKNLPASELRKFGFSTVEADKEKGKCKLNPVNLSLTLEGGASYRLSKAFRAFAGLQFSYCLTNIHKETVAPLLTPERKYNGTLRSSRVDRASLLSVGLTAGVIWEYRATYIRTKPKF